MSPAAKPAAPAAKAQPGAKWFTVEVAIMAADLDTAVDITHYHLLAPLRNAGVPYIHEATRALPSQAARESAAAVVAVPEEPDTFEAVARDLWQGMAMGMALSHFDTHKVHERLHAIAKAEKAKAGEAATQGGSA